MKFIAFLIRHQRVVLLVQFIIGIILAPGLLKLENDNSPSVFFARDAKALKQYENFRSRFGGGELIRVAISGKELWTAKGLEWMATLESDAAELKNVATVLGLSANYRWQSLEWPPNDPEKFKEKILKDAKGIGSGWIEKNGYTVSMLIILEKIPSEQKKILLQQLETLTLKGKPKNIKIQFSGLPIIHLAMDHSLITVVTTFMPGLFILASLLLAIAFRRVSSVLVPLAYVGLFNLILFGVIGYLGESVNLVSIIVAPLLFVISMATAVHLQVRFRQHLQQGLIAEQAVLETYKEKAKPVLWTGITTGVAFGSLVLSGVPPVRWIGLWAGCGIVLMTVLAYTFLPILLVFFKRRKKESTFGYYETFFGLKGKRIAEWAIKKRRTVLLLTAVAMGFGGAGVTRISIDDNIGKYFSPGHPVRDGLEELDRQGIGVFSAELTVSYTNEKSFWDPGMQKKLAKLSAELRKEPLVFGAVSSGDIVDMSIGALMIEGEADENMRWLTLGMLQTVPGSRRLMLSLVTENGNTARITILMPMRSFNRIQPLFDSIRRTAKTCFPNAEIVITGEYPLIIEAQGKLIGGLILSLSLTFGCVALIFWLLVRNIGLTLRVVVPNLWPVVLVLGGMGWLRIPLDSASVMTVSIVLGLAVDDTIHTLGYYYRLSNSLSPCEAIRDTLERTAPAHILTSLVLSAGFVVCGFSSLMPVSRLGFISAIAIILALIGDLIIIPAIIARGMK